MAGEADGDQVRTALVVLAAPNPPGSDSAGRPRAVPPEGAAQVLRWFSSKGFDVTPVVGISFSISAPDRVFRQALGDIDPGSAVEYNRALLADRMGRDLVRHVAAVTIGPAPDFGPGNP